MLCAGCWWWTRTSARGMSRSSLEPAADADLPGARDQHGHHPAQDRGRSAQQDRCRGRETVGEPAVAVVNADQVRRVSGQVSPTVDVRAGPDAREVPRRAPGPRAAGAEPRPAYGQAHRRVSGSSRESRQPVR
eukprot:4305840-Pyramimonas_sp.AAC.1